jgi:molybdopterin-guanine dinucleotide biosynthesis protein B
MIPEYPANVISLVGPSGSGKTGLICRLVACLKAWGHSVAVLKHSHKTRLAETNSVRAYREAGAQAAAHAGPNFLQISRFQEKEPDLAAILSDLASQADVVIVEGYKQSPLPKIAFASSGQDEIPLDASRVIAWLSRKPANSSPPVFHPEDTEAIGAFILSFLGTSSRGRRPPKSRLA